MSLRTLFKAVALCGGLFVSGMAGAQDRSLTLTENQMRGLAIQAVQSGDPRTALMVAGAVLEQKPRDPSLLIVSAEASILLRDFDAALDFATRAWDAAEIDGQLFAAARLAALAHSQLGQDTRAQFWLRRARQYAPTEAAARSVGQDYRLLARRNPFSFRIDFGIAPSDNINDGSSQQTTTILGFPVEFELDGAAQALSGLEANIGTTLRYRIGQTDRSVTTLESTLSYATYWLSDEAKAQAPGTDGSDFAQGQVSFGITHVFGATPRSDPNTLTFGLGQSWYGGDPYSRFIQLGYGRRIGLDERTALNATLSGYRSFSLDDRPVETTLRAGLDWTRIVESGDRLTLSGTLTRLTSSADDTAYRGVGLSAAYALREPVGGVSLAFTGGAELRAYDSSNFVADRRDVRLRAGLTAAFREVEYYGFHPVLTATATRNLSDASRYDTEELSVGLRIQSSF